MSILDSSIASIEGVDGTWAEAARKRQGELAKPRGSLGLLEDISIRIAAMLRTPRPRLGPGAVFVMAGDHGVAAAGVSLYPPEVTGQMVANFLSGGAAINVLARAAGARVVVTDAGVACDIPASPRLYSRKVGRGTADISRGPAMDRDQARRSIETGIEVFEEEYRREAFSIAATGDMGIANTTPSAAIASALSGIPPRELAGRGTGIGDAALERKIAVIEKALSVNAPDPGDALDVLAKVGGFEIGAIAGVCLAAAARRVPLIVDGFISTAGALIAASLAPASKDYMLASHASAERGHRAILEHLGLSPILDLGLRLGEGTGAALAMPICVSACRILDEMATFGEAGVSDKE